MPIPTDHPPRVDPLIDLVAWAKTCLLLAAATAPGTPERQSALTELREAVIEPRRLANEALGRGQLLPQAVLVELRACELAITRLEAGAVLRQQAPVGAGS